MNLGHNSNVHVGGTAYHVQTEDRGSGHPFIDTTVYYGGRVVHRRTTTYADLLNRNDDGQLPLQKRVEEQHRAVIDEIRNGVLKLPVSARTNQNPASSPSNSRGRAGTSPGTITDAACDDIVVTLINAPSWIQAGHANLQIEVRSRETSKPTAAANIVVTLEGAVSPTKFDATTNTHGYAEIKFPLPKMNADGATLVVRASAGPTSDEIRYHLKPKSRAPAPPARVP